jgi:two-component system OmpR family response regulator
MPADTRPCVLCVDENEDLRVMLSTLLRFAFIEAKSVGTAAQALSSIRTERFDLYLLESRLPDGDGFELCRRIRDYDPQAPILFFSGAAYAADKKRGIKAGATGYVVKPDIAGLLRSVMHLVSLAGRPTKHAVPLKRKAKNISPPFFNKTAQSLSAGGKR